MASMESRRVRQGIPLVWLSLTVDTLHRNSRLHEVLRGDTGLSVACELVVHGYLSTLIFSLPA